MKAVVIIFTVTVYILLKLVGHPDYSNFTVYKKMIVNLFVNNLDSVNLAQCCGLSYSEHSEKQMITKFLL